MKIGDGIINTVELAVAAIATIGTGGIIATSGGALAALTGGAVLINCIKREFRGDYQKQIKATCKTVERDQRIIARVKDVDQKIVTEALKELDKIILHTGADAEDFARWNLDPQTVSQRLLDRMAQKNDLFKNDKFSRELAKDVLQGAFSAVLTSEAFFRDTQIYIQAELLARTKSLTKTGEDSNERIRGMEKNIAAIMLQASITNLDTEEEKSIEDTIRGLLTAHEGHRKAAGEKLIAGDVGGAKSALRQLAAQQHDARKQQKDDEAKTWLDIGNIAFLNDTQEALEAFTRVTELTPNDPVGWNQLGRLHCRIGDMNQAKVAFEKVIVIGEKHSDTLILSWAWGNLGNVEQNLGNHEVAIQCFRKSLNFYSDLDHNKGIADQYGNLGNAAQHMKRFDDAKCYYTKALVINKKIGCEEGMASQYNNLGVNALDQKEFKIAESYFEQSLGLFQQHSTRDGIAQNYANFGTLEDCRDNLDKACAYWRQSYDLFAQIGAVAMMEQVGGWMRDAGCDGAPEE